MIHHATLTILTAWQQRMQDCEAQMTAVNALFGAAPESPLPAAVYHLMGDYTRTIAARIDWCGDTLAAWWLEHNFGERPMQIGLGNEPLRTVSTIEELAQFIADDHAKNGGIQA